MSSFVLQLSTIAVALAVMVSGVVALRNRMVEAKAAAAANAAGRPRR